MSRNLIIRIVIAVIFGPLIILISYLGGWWLFGMIMLFAAIGSIEFQVNSGVRPVSVEFWLTLIFTMGIVASSTLVSAESGMMAFVGYLILIGIVSAIKNVSPADLYKRQAWLVWGTAYLGLLYPFVYFIRQLSTDRGGDWLLFLLGTLWLSDTLAMFVGKAIGKRKFAPTVSPNKTMAGFVGGVIGGIIVAVILKLWRLSEIDIALLLVPGILVSIVGQFGDLVESCWKRAVGIKDSSSIIPGHGGVLDRFDSLLFASPVLFLFLKFFVYR
ncbi:MAG: phosphatidate cytidylyltransferase [Candidatus Zixiibacteriota bacterium]|nr:MAG: phosphatidate cytidylyltransferase [candidate division Zixibacteria bacterium]